VTFTIPTSSKPYLIQNPKDIPTPRLLVFENRLLDNIERMRNILKAVNPALGLGDLCVHVKTQKSEWTTRILLEQGVTFFKCSLNEVDMLVDCDVPAIFIAYPLLSADAQRVARLIKAHPDIEFTVQVGHPSHAEILASIAVSENITWRYLIDVNIGMNRTGVQAEGAFALYETIKDSPSLQFVGFHGYDGHIHQADKQIRGQMVTESLGRLFHCINTFDEHKVRIDQVIIGGTPSFIADAEFLQHHRLPTRIYYSPGTWIYFDSKSQELLPDTFDYAALILAQVIDKPTRDTATLNVGHKRWAVDQGPIKLFSNSGLKALSWNEEHTVVTEPQNTTLSIGDYVLFVPAHVCSTVNLWESFVVINKDGAIVRKDCPVDARNR